MTPLLNNILDKSREGLFFGMLLTYFCDVSFKSVVQIVISDIKLQMAVYSTNIGLLELRQDLRYCSA